ncbi:response regulator [Pseudomonas sp. ZM23]|uniref:Response regulator n=1 Tax=Pseudomonas triclosanedens TaxID=2961893 RepID=A0ABY6ZRX2_9PSED|nr:response regulator [Pseudomonas triclosanedens]MCP8467016.1 response regulator [Pseudomonas triclosanedens]MCP8472836.1 response regulator [Pseudomonas triclosanedens]MCP8478267.1 response regulator [Pseudomonas triclosanedens]WAI47672.1 response regulator [Pseudomonas triclosanedens]
MATILLVDVTPIVRHALRGILEELRHEVVSEAEDVPGALMQLRSVVPDLVILDLALPGVGGMDLLRRIKNRNERQRVLVFTRQGVEQFAPLCFQAGADGFVSKDEEVGALRKAISDVLAGRAYFTREQMQPGTGNELARLSTRELAVLQLLAEGNSNLHIADQLLISFKTVSTYKRRLLEKLHAGSTVELAEVARRNGLIPGEAVPEAPTGDMGLLHKLIDASPNPMYVRDEEGRLLFCNQKFLDYYRISAEEALGSGIADTRWFPPDVRERLPEAIRRRVSEGVPTANTMHVEIFGERRVIYFWIVPYRDDSGHFVGLLGGLQDVTENEVQLTHLRDRLLVAESQVGRLLELCEASLQEIGQLLGGLGLHPSTPGLATLSERLQRLQRICDLQAGPLPMRPEPCELPEFLRRQLATRPAVQLSVQRLDASRAWLDLKVFREWLASALALFVPDTSLHVRLTTQTRGRGYLLVRLQLDGEAAYGSVINLTLCQRMAEQLEAVFRHSGADEQLALELDMELPLCPEP